MRVFKRVLVGIVLLGITSIAALNIHYWVPEAPPPISAAPLPADFMWGVSSSAFQSEGGRIDNNILRFNDSEPTQDRYGLSVDFRHRYREDVALAKDLGVNTYRVGINWARVEPQPGKYDEVELAYYDDLMLALDQAGIQPLITLDHFSYPGWIADRGGWTNPETVTNFVSYVQLIAKRYHSHTHWWITFNEAAMYMAIDIAISRPGWEGAGKIRKNLISAHRKSYDVIHAVDPVAQVSSNIVWFGDTPMNRLLQDLTDWSFLDSISDKIDYVGIDYYAADLLKGLITGHHWMWDPNPAGLYRGLRIVSERYPKLPLLIAENGMATENGALRADGVRREDALRDSIYWIQRAKADGVNVIGYFQWSLTDNFEWGSYTPRFGLYTVNVLTDPTLKRIPTPAVPAYRDIIRERGVSSEYRPVDVRR